MTQLSSRSHPRHLVGKRTAQKDTIIDITSLPVLPVCVCVCVCVCVFLNQKDTIIDITSLPVLPLCVCVCSRIVYGP